MRAHSALIPRVTRTGEKADGTMSLPVKVFLVSESTRRAEEVKDNLHKFPTISVVGVYGRWRKVPYEEFVQGTVTDFFLVDVPVPDPAFLRLAEFNKRAFPGSLTVFLMKTPDAAFRELATHAGVLGVFNDPLNYDRLADILHSPHNLTLKRSAEQDGAAIEAEDPKVNARTLALMSAKDGEGKTTIGVNLASLLALGHGLRVILVDLNTNFDDFTVLLNQRSEKHFVELMTMVKNGAPFAAIVKHFGHFRGQNLLRFVCGPCSIRPAALDRKLLITFLNLLKRHCDFLVIDTPVMLNDALSAALNVADDYFLVVQNHVASLRNTRAYINGLMKYEYPTHLIRILLNRISPNVGLATADLEKYLGVHPIAARLVSDGRLVIDALNAGIPFVLSHPSADISRGIETLCLQLVGERDRRLGLPPSTPTTSTPRLEEALPGVDFGGPEFDEEH